MDFGMMNKGHIFNLLYIVTMLWGVYEFKKFNYNIKEIIRIIKDFDKKIENNSDLKKNPFVKNIIDLTEKVNKIINIDNQNNLKLE